MVTAGRPGGGGGGRHSRAPSPDQRRRRTRVQLGAVAAVVVIGAGVLYATVGRGGTGQVSTSVTTITAAPTRHGSVPASSTTTTAPPTVTLSAVGDTELGNTPDLPPDPSAYLAPVESALAAPIVFGNLEGTMTDAAGSKCSSGLSNCYAFHVPTSYAQVMHQAGFTVLNSANNHSYDFGAQGVADTTAALQAAGIVQAGLPGQIGIVTDGTTKVAFVDFAPYSTVNDMLNPTTAKQLIAQAKTEAQVVVVYMHAGAEGVAAAHVTGTEEYYFGEDRGNAEAFAHAVIDDGADLVLASGPHVLRGMQYYNGHLIAYSLGDFACYRNFSTSGALDLSGILRVTLSASGAMVGAHFTSLALSSVGQPALDPTDASARFVNQLSTADFGPAAAIIQPSGDLTLPAAS